MRLAEPRVHMYIYSKCPSLMFEGRRLSVLSTEDYCGHDPCLLHPTDRELEEALGERVGSRGTASTGLPAVRLLHKLRSQSTSDSNYNYC